MQRSSWAILGCFLTLPITVLVTLNILDQKPVPQSAAPPVAPIAEPEVPLQVESPPAEELPWVEEIASRDRGWLIDGRFRYHGRFPDCWVVCEAAGVREVMSPGGDLIARWVAHSKPDEADEPKSGTIDAALALPVASPHCVFGVRTTEGGLGYEWYKPVPYRGHWTRSQRTSGIRSGRQSVARGRSVLLFQHTSELPLDPYFGNWLIQEHLKHAGRHDRGLGELQWRFSDRDGLMPIQGPPAAWTAARMIGLAAAPFSVGFVTPYFDYMESYLTYARVSVYLRFLSEAEVGQLRAEANRRAGDPELQRSLTRIIQSFRGQPKAE